MAYLSRLLRWRQRGARAHLRITAIRWAQIHTVAMKSLCPSIDQIIEGAEMKMLNVQEKATRCGLERLLSYVDQLQGEILCLQNQIDLLRCDQLSQPDVGNCSQFIDRAMQTVNTAEEEKAKEEDELKESDTMQFTQMQIRWIVEETAKASREKSDQEYAQRIATLEAKIATLAEEAKRTDNQQAKETEPPTVLAPQVGASIPEGMHEARVAPKRLSSA